MEKKFIYLNDLTDIDLGCTTCIDANTICGIESYINSDGYENAEIRCSKKRNAWEYRYYGSYSYNITIITKYKGFDGPTYEFPSAAKANEFVDRICAECGIPNSEKFHFKECDVINSFRKVDYFEDDDDEYWARIVIDNLRAVTVIKTSYECAIEEDVGSYNRTPHKYIIRLPEINFRKEFVTYSDNLPMAEIMNKLIDLICGLCNISNPEKMYFKLPCKNAKK